jgi:hypothetical protein
MPETKRGRERTGRNKEQWWRRRDIERELATTDRQRGFEGPTMQVIYTTDWDADEQRTLEVEGFEELAYGVVLFDADGEEMGYIPHEQLVAIVPA